MSKKILIVDELQSFIATARNILERAGYKTLTANDGIEALKLIFSKNPDLVISDLNLPYLNGHHLCRLIKNNPSTKDIPFILLTTTDWERKTLPDLQIKPDEYLIKNAISGVESPILIHMVAHLIGEKKKKILPAKEKIPQNPLDVLFLTNKLLDKKLHKSTIISKISMLSKNVYKFEDTVISILEFIKEIIDYEVATLFIKKLNTAFLLIYLQKPVSNRYIEEIKKNIFSFIQKEGVEYDHEYFKTKTLQSKHFIKEMPASPNLKSYLFSPITSYESIIGVLSLSSGKKDAFGEESKEIFEDIVNISNMVLDNVTMHEQLKILSITDTLTSLYNHRYFQEKLENEFNRAQRYNLTFSVTMIDIDDFRKINEDFGYQMGDIVLRDLAKLIYQNFRIMDICARYGGEEFSIILPETDLKGAKFSAERLRITTSKHIIKGLDKNITISIGISEYSPKLKDRRDLLIQAEKALQKAKEEGKNKTSVWKE